MSIINMTEYICIQSVVKSVNANVSSNVSFSLKGIRSAVLPVQIRSSWRSDIKHPLYNFEKTLWYSRLKIRDLSQIIDKYDQYWSKWEYMKMYNPSHRKIK